MGRRKDSDDIFGGAAAGAAYGPVPREEHGADHYRLLWEQACGAEQEAVRENATLRAENKRLRAALYRIVAGEEPARLIAKAALPVSSHDTKGKER